MAKQKGKPIGVRESVRLNTVAQLKSALKKNLFAIQLLKEQRAELLKWKAELENRTTSSSEDNSDRGENERPEPDNLRMPRVV